MECYLHYRANIADIPKNTLFSCFSPPNLLTCNCLCNMYFLFVFDLFFMKKGWHVDFDQHQSLLAFQILDEIDPPYVMKNNPWNRRELSFNFLKSY